MADTTWVKYLVPYGLAQQQMSLDTARHYVDAHEVLAPANLAVDFAVRPAAAALQPDVAVCQNLYLIYKEALHNVVQHAHQATRGTVRLSKEGNQLCLAVRDDAPGPAPTARPGGRSLANMRQRAEAVGGALHFVAGAAGFSVVACLPG